MSETVISPLDGQAVSDEKLSGIAELARRQYKLEEMVTQLEERLELVNKELKQVSENLLPDAMTEIGMTEFSLSNGYKIQVGRFFSASIPEEHRPAAFEWLRSNGHGSLIKRNIICKFGKGEDKVAEKVFAHLCKLGVIPEDKQSVHPQTLKAFVREQIEGGKNLPMETLGVYVGNRAKITPPNK